MTSRERMRKALNHEEPDRVPIEEDGSFEDEWGIYRKRVGYYCENVRAPLAGMSKKEIIKHRFPDPSEKSRFMGLREKAKEIYETTDFALMAGHAATIFYFSSELTGYNDFMLDLAQNQARIEVIVEKVPAYMRRYLLDIG